MTAIVHVAAELGQGGTERAIELLATFAEGPPGQRVAALDRDGPTGERLRAAGVEVKVFAGDYAAAGAWIAGRGPAVALLNRSGKPDPKWNGLIRALAGGPVMPLEVNHFGWLDRGAIADGLKGSFCVSGTALAKYLRQLLGHWPTDEELAALPLAVCAGNNPVAPPELPAADRAGLRQVLGLPSGAFLALRIGRPDPRKWSDLLILHGSRLLAELPRLHFVFLSAPENREPVIRRLLGDRATLVPFTADRGLVTRHLAAADVMLHYARYGESFGYALAEAALAGLPVIVQSTPWGDNAQVELIRDGETGFVVRDYLGAKRALAKLMNDPSFAAALVERARADMATRFGIGGTWRLMRAFIDHALAGGRGLLTAPEDLAHDQRQRLAAGIAAYGEGNPWLARLAAERPLYPHPWFWRLFAADGAAIVKRRLVR
jgi:glycosyltransferase involved in cell wall biosynthesis